MPNTLNIQHIWSVVCDDAVVDSRTNNISLHNALELLTIETKNNDNLQKIIKQSSVEKPVILPIRFTIVSSWLHNKVRSSTALKMKIEIVSPKGKIIATMANDIKVDSEKNRTRTIARVEGLPIIAEFGLYKFLIKIKTDNNNTYKKVAELPLEIITEG